jgi:hypothetical protein
LKERGRETIERRDGKAQRLQPGLLKKPFSLPFVVNFQGGINWENMEMIFKIIF